MGPFLDQWSDQEQDDLEPSRGVMGAMEKRKAWQHKLNEDRWAAILWPEEWGGPRRDDCAVASSTRR